MTTLSWCIDSSISNKSELAVFPLDTGRSMGQYVGGILGLKHYHDNYGIFVNLHFMFFDIYIVYLIVIQSLVNTKVFGKDLYAISFLLFPLLGSFTPQKARANANCSLN